MFYRSLVSHKVTRKSFLTVSQGGFGLIELMVSISVMTLVATVILVQQNSFNASSLLRSQAYAIALDLRQVQLDAVSASGNSAVGNPDMFRSVLGIYFDTANGGQYAIYRDVDSPQNGYDASEVNGIQGNLDSRFEIRSIRAGGSDINDVSIQFQRPNFDAIFFEGTTEINPANIEIDVARVGETGSGVEVLRTIEVTSTGQITVL